MIVVAPPPPNPPAPPVVVVAPPAPQQPDPGALLSSMMAMIPSLFGGSPGGAGAAAAADLQKAAERQWRGGPLQAASPSPLQPDAFNPPGRSLMAGHRAAGAGEREWAVLQHHGSTYTGEVDQKGRRDGYGLLIAFEGKAPPGQEHLHHHHLTGAGCEERRTSIGTGRVSVAAAVDELPVPSGGDPAAAELLGKFSRVKSSLWSGGRRPSDQTSPLNRKLGRMFQSNALCDCPLPRGIAGLLVGVGGGGGVWNANTGRVRLRLRLHSLFPYSRRTFYDGQWRRDRRHGAGILSWEGHVMEGTWVGGLAHGECRIQFRNGDTFVGTFARDAKNGPGRYTWQSSGAEESGEYLENEKEGVHLWRGLGLDRAGGAELEELWERRYSAGRLVSETLVEGHANAAASAGRGVYLPSSPTREKGERRQERRPSSRQQITTPTAAQEEASSVLVREVDPKKRPSLRLKNGREKQAPLEDAGGDGERAAGHPETRRSPAQGQQEASPPKPPKKTAGNKPPPEKETDEESATADPRGQKHTGADQKEPGSLASSEESGSASDSSTEQKAASASSSASSASSGSSTEGEE